MAGHSHEIPSRFMNSDDEEEHQSIPIKTTPMVIAEPMMVNSSTSTGAVTILRPVKVASASNKVTTAPNPEAKPFQPRTPLPREAGMDVRTISKQYSDIMTSVNTIISKQNTIHNMMIELKAEFDVLRRSSARFQTPHAVSEMKAVRRTFKP